MLKKGDNDFGPSNNNIDVVQGNYDEGDDGEVLAVCTSSSADAWVLDSRASYHTTCNSNWFDSFKEWNGKVKMGDDWLISIKGSGMV